MELQRNVSSNQAYPVSYTHLDVYKRQSLKGVDVVEMMMSVKNLRYIQLRVEKEL